MDFNSERGLLTMFLRKMKNKKTGRTYLSIVHSYRDKETKKTRSKTIQSPGVFCKWTLSSRTAVPRPLPPPTKNWVRQSMKAASLWLKRT